MKARVVRFPPDRPPRVLEFDKAPQGDLNVVYVGGERRVTLTMNPSSPRNVIPELRAPQLDGLHAQVLRLRGFVETDGRRQELVWLCEIQHV